MNDAGGLFAEPEITFGFQHTYPGWKLHIVDGTWQAEFRSRVHGTWVRGGFSLAELVIKMNTLRADRPDLFGEYDYDDD